MLFRSVAEAGYPGYNVVTWNGLMAPAGTPRPIVDRIAAEFGHAVRDQKFAERLTAFGVDPLGNSPSEFAALIAAEIRQWIEAVNLAGAKSP